MTYLIYHSSPFSSIANALQPGEIDPCLSPFQTFEADRSGIFPAGSAQFPFSPDLQLPASCAGAVAGGGLFGAPSAGPGLPAVAFSSCPAMAGPAFLYAAAGSQLGGEEHFYLGWSRGVGRFRRAVCRLVPGGGSGQGWGSPLGDGSGGG